LVIDHFNGVEVATTSLAAQQGLVFVTHNTRDFKVGEKLEVLVPYRL